MNARIFTRAGFTLWLALGVFAGVLSAQLLSTWMSPPVAWLLGGALIGLVPSPGTSPRSLRRTLVIVVSTACVASVAHGLGNLVP